jgi:lipopolysaccharide transport system ATP-binding protein
VKRYSSGMYVRLAFAVAAHLQPEILLVDEVLAVGDISFQKKCLGKMEEVATQGRTVLFVSHNMGAISRLCRRALLLNEGRLVQSGPALETIQRYTVDTSLARSEYIQPPAPDKTMHLRRVVVIAEAGQVRAEVGYHERFSIHVEYDVNEPISGSSVGIALFSADGTCIFASADLDAHPELLEQRDAGHYQATIDMPGQWLAPGRYVVHVHLASSTGSVVYDRPEALVFTIVDTGTPGSKYGVNRLGVLHPILEWKTNRTT